MSSIEITTDHLNKIAQIDSKEHTISFMLSLKRVDNQDIVTMHLSGFNKDTNQDIKWFDERLTTGLEINIKVSENQNANSEPIEIKQFPDSFIDDQKIKTYKFLQKELAAKGLI